jgi:hypothetical protein
VYYNVCYGRAFRTHEAHVGNLRKIVDSVSGDDRGAVTVQSQWFISHAAQAALHFVTLFGRKTPKIQAYPHQFLRDSQVQ